MTTKQEGFCQSYLETGNASEAYRLNYSTENMKTETIHREAHSVLENPKVSARVKELRSEIELRNQVTLDSLIAELEEARQAALTADTPQAAAATGATLGKAKLLGYDKPQQVEVTGRDGGAIEHVVSGKVEIDFSDIVAEAKGGE